MSGTPGTLVEGVDEPRGSVETPAGQVHVEALDSLSPEQMHHLIQNTLMLLFFKIKDVFL